MDLKEILEKRKNQYKTEHPPDFETHLNYITCFNTLSKDLKLECKLDIKNKIKEHKNLKKKFNLISLTKKNLDEEYKIVRKNPEFAEMCVPWIAVKAYYLIFNLQLVLKYLLTSDENSFNSKHKEMLSNFKEFIKNGSLSFNNVLFNKIYSSDEMKNFKFPAGYNIKFIDVEPEKRFQQIIKKLFHYKVENFRREKNIKSLKKKKYKEIMKAFLKGCNINICDFFYWYRIKSNYRDLEFLDKEIKSERFGEFYKNFYELTMIFYNSLRNLVNELAIKRLGKEII